LRKISLEKFEEGNPTLPSAMSRRLLAMPARCAMTIILLGALVGATAEGNPTRVVLSPSSQQVPVGQIASFDIRIEEVVGLYGAEVHLSFDPEIVGVREIRDSDLLADGYSVQGIDNEAGTFYYARTLLYPAPPVTGSGALASVTLAGKSQGTSPLRFTTVKLADQNAEQIAASAEDGSVMVTLATIYLPIVTKNWQSGGD